MPALLVSLFLFQPSVEPAQAKLDLASVRAAVLQVNELLARDSPFLWGTSLAQPLLFANPASRAAISNQAPSDQSFTQQGDLWMGTIPGEFDLHTVLLTWAATTWSVVRLPLPADSAQIEQTLIETLWRSKALELGLSDQIPANRHLQGVEGRVWMRLEWQALAKALQSSGLTQRAAVADALTFRRHRRGLTQNAPIEEQTRELMDGLGAYTRLLLMGHDAPVQVLLQRLPQAELQNDFAATFAQWSGPAYGLLLDEHRPGWRQQVQVNQDLALMLEIGMKLIVPRAWYEAADLRAAPYRVNHIRREEQALAERRAQRIAQLEAKFVQGPLLKLPLLETQKLQMPRGSQELGIFGQWLPTLQIESAWGTLRAQQGIRLHENHLFLPMPFESHEETLTGKGWELEILAPWQPAPDDREGDLVLTVLEETEEKKP